MCHARKQILSASCRERTVEPMLSCFVRRLTVLSQISLILGSMHCATTFSMCGKWIALWPDETAATSLSLTAGQMELGKDHIGRTNVWIMLVNLYIRQYCCKFRNNSSTALRSFEHEEVGAPYPYVASFSIRANIYGACSVLHQSSAACGLATGHMALTG